MKCDFRIFIMLVFLLSLHSCKNTKEAEAELHKAEVYMDKHPELALETLESIDIDKLASRKTQAKYALLYSMALDKNFIDVACDSIIFPALSYYKHHGSPDDKLKVNYYWGRIAMNSGEFEEAISRFIKAEEYANRASDISAIGKLYKAQSTVYKYCYDTEAMIEASQKTADAYITLNDTVKYINSLFDVTAGYLNKIDTTNAKKTLNLIKEHWGSINDKQRSSYYAYMLILNGHTGSLPTREILSIYFEEISSPQLIRWLSVAKAYYSCEEYDKALDAIGNYDYYGGEQNAFYYWTAGLIYEAFEDYLKAMLCYKKYIELNDDKLGYLLEADIRFVKERHNTEIRITRNHFIIITLTLSALTLLLSSILIIDRIKRIKQDRKMSEDRLRLELRAIEAEKIAEKLRYDKEIHAALLEIDRLNHSLENNALDKVARMHIVERLSLLNKLIASIMTPNLSENGTSELKELMQDKKRFIESTRISFLVEHPEFIQLLKRKGLTDREIGYCCLYAMGLKGKDISAYMGNGHYKLSSTIRKKFGLSEHDTNLDKYLKELLTEFR